VGIGGLEGVRRTAAALCGGEWGVCRGLFGVCSGVRRYNRGGLWAHRVHPQGRQSVPPTQLNKTGPTPLLRTHHNYFLLLLRHAPA
jgi:hypothetical protein